MLAGRTALAEVWRPATTKALVVFLTLMLLATIHSSDPSQSLVGEPLQYQGLLATLGYASAFLAARRWIAHEPRRSRFIAVIVTSAGLAGSYGLAQEMRLDPIWHVLDRGRVFSTLGQANWLAAYLVLALPLAIGLAAVSPRIGRAAWTSAALVIGLALALTMSRGGYLGAAVSLVGWTLCVGRRPILTRRRVALALGVVTVGISVVVLVPSLNRTVTRVVERGLQIADAREGSIASHLDLWAVGFRIALDHPMLGVGPEMYPAMFPRYRDVVLSPSRAAVMARFRPESPHNVPIAIADGAGVPAVLAYGALVLIALVTGLRRMLGSSPRERLLLASLVAALAGHLVTDLFITAEVAGSWTAWALLGVLAATPPAIGVEVHTMARQTFIRTGRLATYLRPGESPRVGE